MLSGTQTYTLADPGFSLKGGGEGGGVRFGL